MGRTSPVVGRVSPAVGRVSPAVGRVSPAVGRVSPVVGRVSPVVGRVNPASVFARSTEKPLILPPAQGRLGDGPWSPVLASFRPSMP